jgi:hypothetical protein
MKLKYWGLLAFLMVVPFASQAADLSAPWALGDLGNWSVQDGVLRCQTVGEGDPRHVWVDQDFGTGDYTVTCDIRMISWTDADASRAGVSVRINPDDGQHGLNLLLHNDTNSVDMLNDMTAWGPNGDYAWSIGVWYTMVVAAEGDTITGTIYEKGTSPAEGLTLEWTDERNGARSPGFPGLAAPNNAGQIVEFNNFEVAVDGQVVFSDDFGVDPVKQPKTAPEAPWVVGTYGEWYTEDGFMISNADVQGDPRHVWVDQDFGSDYTVVCDVRMLNWLDADLSRAGVAVRINPDDSERGLNLLFHDDTGSIDMLNDGTAWGPRGNFEWKPGTWYTMTLTAEGNVLTGTIAEKDNPSNSLTQEWDDERNGARAPGFAGLTGSTGPALITQYDNFQVLVNGEVAFEDDFGGNFLPNWVVTRDINGNSWSIGQVIDTSLSVSGTAGSLTIEEVVPAELEPMNINASSGSASFADGKITWTLSDLSGSETLTYSMQAPSGEGPTFVWGGSATDGEASTDLDGTFFERFQGDTSMPFLMFNIVEAFSYPTNDGENTLDGQAIAGQDGGFGWNGPWVALNESESVVFSVDTLDAGIVRSQPTEYNPGNYSAVLTGEVGQGLTRKLEYVVTGGDLWISYTYQETGPAANHWSGITLFNDQGTEVSFIGKPYNSEFCGIGNLPDGDVLTSVPYTSPNHILVRILVKGSESMVYMWVNPDKEDRMDTYDAGGQDSIDNIAEIRLRRGGAAGEARYDNMILSSVPALPPAGAGRVNLRIDDPNRPAELPAWDVISMDQIDDAIVGEYGFGHDNGDDHYLVVTGYIYFPDLTDTFQQVVAFGLPMDRMSGLNGHILGNFNFAIDGEGFKNAIKFENNPEQSGPFTFDLVPPGNYAELRSAQTVANGDGQLFCTLHYEDGSTEDTFLNADDWYNDGAEIQFANTRLMVDGMNRLQGSDSNFDARFDPAVFECIISCDPSKVLTQITLEYNPGISEAEDYNAAYNLFDIWAVPASEDEPGVEDWQLF